MNSISKNYYNNHSNLSIPSLARIAEQNIENFGDDNTNYIPNYQINNLEPSNPPPIPTPQLNPQEYPLNQHIDRQPLPQTYKQLVPNQYNVPSISSESFEEKGIFDIIREKLVITKEYLVILCLFVILSNKSVRVFLRTSIPIINNYDSELPASILGGIILVFLLYSVKKWF